MVAAVICFSLPTALITVFSVWAVGCTGIAEVDGDDDIQTDGNPEPTELLDPDAPPITEGDWYRPMVETTWQWQLQPNADGGINTTYDVEIYDIDLFDASDSRPPDLWGAQNDALWSQCAEIRVQKCGDRSHRAGSSLRTYASYSYTSRTIGVRKNALFQRPGWL